MSETIKTLGDALPEEMARVRDSVLPAYLEIGPAGAIAAAMMREDLDRAARALASGDVVEMVRSNAVVPHGRPSYSLSIRTVSAPH